MNNVVFTPNGEKKVKVEKNYIDKMKKFWKFAIENLIKKNEE